MTILFFIYLTCVLGKPSLIVRKRKSHQCDLSFHQMARSWAQIVTCVSSEFALDSFFFLISSLFHSKRDQCLMCSIKIVAPHSCSRKWHSFNRAMQFTNYKLFEHITWDCHAISLSICVSWAVLVPVSWFISIACHSVCALAVFYE